MAGLPQPTGRGRRPGRPWVDGLFGIGLVAVAAVVLGAAALVLALAVAALS